MTNDQSNPNDQMTNPYGRQVISLSLVLMVWSFFGYWGLGIGHFGLNL